jgi:hypothetical protein
LIASKGPYVLQASWSGPAASAELGASISMWHDSATDADWAIVGAPVEDMFTGAAYIYRRSSAYAAWTLEAKLTAPDSSTDSEFGFAVAIDGDTVVVTAPLHVSSFFHGAAYVFVRDPSTGLWNQQGDEFNNDAQSFGVAAALHGNVLAISDPGADEVHVYQRTAGVWSSSAVITRPSAIGSNANFGASLWTDGDTLLIGAPADSAVASKQGSCSVYSLSGDTRTPTQIVRPEIDTSAGQAFGTSVALSTHGILIGSPRSSGGAGAANSYLFDSSMGRWSQQSKFSDAAGGTTPAPGFGQSIATAGDMLVIGNPSRDRVSVYTYGSGTWRLDSTLNGNSTSLFGYAVAAANRSVGVGALLDGTSTQGAAYIFISDRIFADGIE